MLDTTTKKRIDDCRDILVGKLPELIYNCNPRLSDRKFVILE